MRPAASIVVVFGAIGLILGLSTKPHADEPASGLGRQEGRAEAS